jgi:hypothetical protein
VAWVRDVLILDSIAWKINRSPPLFSAIFNSLYPTHTFYLSPMVCSNICEKISSKSVIGNHATWLARNIAEAKIDTISQEI